MGFSNILGQEAAVAVLRRLHEKRLRPPFLLFTGPSGVGKKNAALEFTASLLCDAPDPAEGGCGACDSCGRLARLSHPNLTLIDFSYQQAFLESKTQAVSLKIDTMREAIRILSLRPYADQYGICIVDAAESLTVQAQNAALKFLEETPPYLIWIWLAQAEEALLPTIVSRASFKVRFRPLPADCIARLLEEQDKIPAREALRAAEASAGSLERAKKMLEKGTSALETSLSSAGGAITPAQAFTLSQRIARFRNYASSRKAVYELLEELKGSLFSHWRASGEPRSVQGLQQVLSAQKDLDANLAPPLVLEHLLLKLGNFTS